MYNPKYIFLKDKNKKFIFYRCDISTWRYKMQCPNNSYQGPLKCSWFRGPLMFIYELFLNVVG